jgi:hypothetical protein
LLHIFKISNFMKKLICLFLVITVLSLAHFGCKRGRSCDDKPLNEYYDIPISTIPFILNKKNEILVFANSQGDTIEFLFTEVLHNYELIYSDPQYGSIDCFKQYKKYAEYYKFKYKGDTAFFAYMNVKYEAAPLINLVTGIEIAISDSIYDEQIFERLINDETPKDSIIYLGQNIIGNYLSNKKILFNIDIGLIKFIDERNIVWQLIEIK